MSHRDVYCRDRGGVAIEYMHKLYYLRALSFPIGPDYSVISRFPRDVEVVECRNVDILTDGLLETIVESLPVLRTLRIDCGEEGPYQPISCEGKSGHDIGVSMRYIFH